MMLIWFTNNGTKVTKERQTLNTCIEVYKEARKHGNANWGHVYIDGDRIWI